MPEETSVKELCKGKAYIISIGGFEIVALKLEGFKALQIGGAISPINVSAEGSKVEGDDWLVIVKDPQKIVQPYETWVKQVSTQITNASGSLVSTISVLNPISLEVLKKQMEELEKRVKELEKRKTPRLTETGEIIF
jgi:hypothetical protein